MAYKFTDVMTDEAVDYVSKRTIGKDINWNRTDVGNPHKWSNEAGHPQYNKDALEIGRKFIADNGITKDSLMTVKQASQLDSTSSTRVQTLYPGVCEPANEIWKCPLEAGDSRKWRIKWLTGVTMYDTFDQ